MRGNWFYEINSLLLTVSYKRVCLIVRHITSLGRMEDFAKRLSPRLKVAIKSRDEYRKIERLNVTFTAKGKMKFSFCQNKEKLDLFKLLSCPLPRYIE